MVVSLSTRYRYTCSIVHSVGTRVVYGDVIRDLESRVISAVIPHEDFRLHLLTPESPNLP